MKEQKRKQEEPGEVERKKEKIYVRCSKKVCVTGVCLVVTLMSLIACASPFPKESGERGTAGERQQEDAGEAAAETRADTGFVLTGPDSYDSADTPVVVDINRDDDSVTFLNLEVGKRYTLSVDGTTRLSDRHGESISLDQVNPGDIVNVTFLKSQKHLTTLQLSPKAWRFENVERYEMNTVREEVTIGQEVFKLSEHTQYLSDGRSIEKMELNAADVLSFQGIDKEILSVSVEKGHGYLRLANDENFIGGWIEIGQSLIQQITQDMLLTVPEGSYQVDISYNGSGGTKSVVINRDEETTLDIGDLKIEAPKYGTILFSVSPSDTVIYIDGEKVEASEPVVLEYGIHQLIAKADGYQSITRYLRVGEETAGIDVVLDAVGEEDEEDSKESSGRDESEDSQKDPVTDYYKVYVDAPEQAEVYLDGNYVGISPCSFRKSAGTHVITLRKNGYVTRSYTVQIDEEKKDFSYSFADLVPTESAAKESAEGAESTETAEGTKNTESTESTKNTEDM